MPQHADRDAQAGGHTKQRTSSQPTENPQHQLHAACEIEHGIELGNEQMGSHRGSDKKDTKIRCAPDGLEHVLFEIWIAILELWDVSFELDAH